MAVLCCYFAQELLTHIYFKTGVKDKTRFIPIHDMAASLGKNMCKIIPALHCLTGCDSTSGLFGIGKTKPVRWAMNNEKDASLLGELGESEVVSEQLEEACTHLICQMYDQKHKGKNINDLRYRLFCRKQSRNEDLPPTTDSLRQHIKRANYQCLVWKLALQSQPLIPSPVGNGWCITEGEMHPVLMTLDPAPKALLNVITCACKTSGCRGRCTCSSEGLICTAACNCEGGETCHNPHKASEYAVCEESSEEDASDDE